MTHLHRRGLLAGALVSAAGAAAHAQTSATPAPASQTPASQVPASQVPASQAPAAPEAQPGASAPAPPPAGPKILIETSLGGVLIGLYADKAPITCKNFLRYVQGRRFDGTSFYRAVNTPGAPGNGFVQGGAQNDRARVFPPIPHESTLQTGLRHGDGTLSMARGAPGTATGDFFITVGPAAYFDADPTQPGDNLGYAAFAQVLQGMDVVRKILTLPANGFARNPVMKGQILSPPAPILRMRVQTA